MEARPHQRIITAFLFLLFLSTLYGCTGVQTFPQFARVGDTITLAIGSLDNITIANTTATYHTVDLNGDPTGVSYELTPGIRNIFKLYPDKTSPAWHATDTQFMKSWSGHGPWMSVMVLDIPKDAGIPEGAGWVKVEPGIEAEYPNNSKRVESVNIDLEILPGQGSTNPFDYLGYSANTTPKSGNLDLLSPAPQVIVRLPATTGTYYGSNVSTSIAAAEYVFNIQIRDSAGNPVLDNDAIRVVLDEAPLPPGSQAQPQLSWVRNGDVFTVNIISATGTIESGYIRLSVLLLNKFIYDFGVINKDVNFVGIPDITSVSYYDQDGYEVTVPAWPEIVLRN